MGREERQGVREVLAHWDRRDGAPAMGILQFNLLHMSATWKLVIFHPASGICQYPPLLQAILLDGTPVLPLDRHHPLLVPRQSMHLWPTISGSDVHVQASRLSSFPC